MEKYKWWDVYETMPDGWMIDKTVGTPLSGHDVICNGKSVFNGGKRALCKVRKEPRKEDYRSSIVDELMAREDCSAQAPEQVPVRAINELARKRFELQMMRDIRIDLAICEIEGWDKREYVRELRDIISSIQV